MINIIENKLKTLKYRDLITGDVFRFLGGRHDSSVTYMTLDNGGYVSLRSGFAYTEEEGELDLEVQVCKKAELNIEW